MESASFAKVDAVNYPPGALGAGGMGPVDIQHVVSFAKEIDCHLKDNHTIGVFCSEGATATTLLLLGAYLVLARGFTAKQAYCGLPRVPFQKQRFPAPWAKVAKWHAHSLTVMDCLEGLEAALRHRWLDYEGFDGKEWRRLLKTYDASFTFHLPIGDPAESRRLTFFAMADPVTTVADPSVRPAPPEDGFVTDYVNIPRDVRHRGSRGKRRPDPSMFVSEPSVGAPRREKIADEHLVKTPCGDKSPCDGCASVPMEILAGTQQPLPMATVTSMRSDNPHDGEEQHTPEVILEPMARDSAQSHKSDGDVTWLETVRVRRWGHEQHSRQSSLPVGIIKERGLTTLPEFGTWLRSVGCRRLVQLNFANEPNLPPGGSYMDYFTQWQVNQEHLRFVDGKVPPPEVVMCFRSVVEQVLEDMRSDIPDGLHGSHGAAVVVHCTGGLGRTGTLLGTLAIDMAGVSGGAWMGWVRMCRPGAVQTLAQEAFLKTYRAEERVEAKAKPLGCFRFFR